MAYPLSVKERAVELRKKGYSIKEVANELHIAKSTSSLWLRHIELNENAKQRLKQRRIYGQYKARQTQKLKRQLKIKKCRDIATNELESNKLSNTSLKLLCSFLFWAEGGKETYRVKFVNSDPCMIEVFLKLLRIAFPVDEKKFRACVHIHEYHNETQIKRFWSLKTKIPLSQFNKSYKKPHTKKRKKPGYMGCLSITYYDYKIALELNSLYNVYSQNFLGA